MKSAHVNANGIEQIAKALGKFHKLGKDHFTDEMIRAWAADVENSLDNGNDASFEIKSWDSSTGRVELVSITDDGYDFEELSED